MNNKTFTFTTMSILLCTLLITNDSVILHLVDAVCHLGHIYLYFYNITLASSLQWFLDLRKVFLVYIFRVGLVKDSNILR